MGGKSSKSKKGKKSGNILNRLTGIGYSVDEALDAIAKYGNDFDQCSSYLSSKRMKISYSNKSTKSTTATKVDFKYKKNKYGPPPVTAKEDEINEWLQMNYQKYEPYKDSKIKPSQNKQENRPKFGEYDIKELIVTGYIRHCIFILLQYEEESIMNIIPSDVIKLCEQYYEANMIMFIIQSCFNQSLLNGVECINLNCHKIIKFKTVSMADTDTLVTTDQHWFDKTVSTYYLPNITIPQQAFNLYPDILSSIQEPSIILKCNLNSWREQHKSSMIIFDNRLLNNWSFNQLQQNNNNGLLTDIDGNTKMIDSYELQLPVIEHENMRKSQLRMFVYSNDHGLLAMDNYDGFTIHRLKFGENEDDMDNKSSDDGWKWVQLNTSNNNNMNRIQNVCGMCVVESASLEFGKYEKLFMLNRMSEDMHRIQDGSGGYKRVKSMKMEIAYFDPMNSCYHKLSEFIVNGEAMDVSYWSSSNYYGALPNTTHKGHQWIQPSLYYNKTHKKVFIGGDDTHCIEGYDIIKDKWMFLANTEYIHLKGCTVWSLADQSHDILYIDQGKKTTKTDNIIEFFDLRSNEKWRISDHYMQWKQIAKDYEKQYDYHIYRRSFI